MIKKKTSIDGFILKRPSRDFNESILLNKKVRSEIDSQSSRRGDSKIFEKDYNIRVSTNNRDDFTASKLIDTNQNTDQFSPTNQDNVARLGFKQRRQVKKDLRLQKKRQVKIRRKTIKLVFLIGLFLVLIILGYGLYRFLLAGSNIFEGNIFDAFKSVPLKQDANGRSNFLILGTSDDDLGHEGPNLTDTIIIVSVNQSLKDAYVFSIPRDLYVKYNRPCLAGYSGKINAYFYCVSELETAEAEQDRLNRTKDFIGEIIGLEMHYAVRVNYTVVKEAVDAVGGVDVDIQGSGGAPGILDRHFDYLCDYKCYMVKYENGFHHLDGTQALNLARARGESAPTYGLARSNFDREINQQKIIIALKDKAKSSGTLADFNKIMKLVDALGNNLRTNVQIKELKTIVNLARNIDSTNIYRLSLVGDDGLEPILITADNNVIPKKGYFEYDGLREFIDKNVTSDPIKKEAARVLILNGSSEVGLGIHISEELSSLGLVVAGVDNAPDGDYDQVEIYQKLNDKPATASKLSDLYGADIRKSEPPFDTEGDADFIIIFGDRSSESI